MSQLVSQNSQTDFGESSDISSVETNLTHTAKNENNLQNGKRENLVGWKKIIDRAENEKI